jgi:hypothetical protein
MERVGSILHGAYGDYFEQMLCLKALKRRRPGTRLVLFFATESRMREMSVFDLSFADEVHAADALPHVRVDRFHQFQIKEPELQDEIILKLPPPVLAQFDLNRNRKPWSTIRSLDFRDPHTDVGLSDEGHRRLPECMRGNAIDPTIFEERATIGFLWRYRTPGGHVSPIGQTEEELVRRTKSDLLSQLSRRCDAHVLVCGMNVSVTDENRERIDNKFSEGGLDVDPARCTYLKGLSWGLELEILRRCSLCVVMPSGFSEALWMKRHGPTVLVDSPRHYLLKVLWNRMPLFGLRSPSELAFQLRQPHTAERVIGHLERRGLIPQRAGVRTAAAAA